MKKFDNLTLSENKNTLKNLTNTSIPQKIVDFIKENPFPKDHDQFHEYAEEIGIDDSLLEEYVYAMLTIFFLGGASKGKEIKASIENIEIGHKIEIEHCAYDSDNKVVKAIQDIFANKVTMDHLAEDPNYYTSTINFKDELKKEKNKEEFKNNEKHYRSK